MDENKINAILKKQKSALEAQLAINAAKVATAELKGVEKNKNAIAAVTASYVNQYKNGGSYCPDPDNLGKAIKVNWIDERYAAAKDDIIKYLEAYNGSQSPTELTNKLNEVFKDRNEFTGDATKDLSSIFKHDIDAKRIIRTETEKIRTAAKMTNMRANNVKYVRYVAVMDDRVRPEHAALDGQIFPIDEAPVLGEPNCRCTYVPATESEYDEQKREYKYEEGDWTAEKAQKWLESPDGRETGLQIATERARTLEEKRELFRKTMKELEGEARLNVLKLNSYRPEWLEAQTNVIAAIPYDVFKVLEETTDVFPKIDIDSKVVDKSNYLERGFAELYKANVDTCSEFFRDFPEAADFKKLTIKAGKIGKKSVTNGLFDMAEEEVTLYANVMLRVYNGEIVLLGSTIGDSTSILLHEAAHALTYKYKRMGAQFNLYNTFFEMNPDVKLEDAPSEYGMTNRAEFSAECIADYYFNKGSAKPISKRFVAFAKERMNEIRNR